MQDTFEIVGLAAGTNVALLSEQIKKFKPKVVSVKVMLSEIVIVCAVFLRGYYMFRHEYARVFLPKGYARIPFPFYFSAHVLHMGVLAHIHLSWKIRLCI